MRTGIAGPGPGMLRCSTLATSGPAALGRALALSRACSGDTVCGAGKARAASCSMTCLACGSSGILFSSLQPLLPLSMHAEPLTLSLREGRPLSWAPSADAVAGGGQGAWLPRCRNGFGFHPFPKSGQDMLAEHLDRLQHALMRNCLSLHNQDHLIDTDVFIQLHAFDTAIRVAGNDDTTLTQCVSIHLGKGSSGCSRPRIQGDPGLLCLGLVRLIRLSQPPPEVGLQMLRNTTPGLQQLLVGVNPVAYIRLVRPKEGFERQGAQFTCLLVVFAATRLH